MTTPESVGASDAGPVGIELETLQGESHSTNPRWSLRLANPAVEVSTTDMRSNDASSKEVDRSADLEERPSPGTSSLPPQYVGVPQFDAPNDLAEEESAPVAGQPAKASAASGTTPSPSKTAERWEEVVVPMTVPGDRPDESRTRRSCCARFVGRLLYAQHFLALIDNSPSENAVYRRIVGAWTLLGVVGTFFASMSHVGFLEYPSFFTSSTDFQTGQRAWWIIGYAIMFYFSVLANLLCIACAAFLMSLLAFVPGPSLRFTLRKLLFTLVLPSHLIFLGFSLLTGALVFLTRVVYSDNSTVVWVAGISFGVGALLLLIGFLYFSFKRARVRVRRETASRSCFQRFVGAITLSRFFLKMADSGLDGEDIQVRMTSMWTTTSLVGAILGAAGFEGLWLRPSFAEGTEIQDENPMRIYAVAIYLSVVLNMFAVLTANGFMVADLFFQGKDGTKALLHKYYHIAGVPSYFLFLGKVSFVVALPYFTETVYGRNGEGWTTAVVVTAFLAGGLVLVVFGRFLMSKTLAEDGQEGQEAEERDSTSAEQGQRSTVRSCRSKLGDIFLLTSYWQSLFHDKNMSEERLYTRVANMLSTVSMVSALLTFISFVLIQTFSEYLAVAPTVLPVFAGSILVSLFFTMAATLLSTAYLMMMVVVPKGRLRSWLNHKSTIIFIPALFLAGGVIGILVGTPCLAYIVYPPVVFWVTVGCVAWSAVYMLYIRFAAIRAVPRAGESDEDLPERSQPTCWSLLTGTHLIEILLHSLDERALFDRLRNVLQAVAFVAALLALTSTDSLREVPEEALVPNLLPVFDEVKQTTIFVNSTKAGDDWTKLAYGVSSAAALTFNLLTLFLGTFLSIVLCLVPVNAVKLFTYRMRGILLLPVLGLSLAASATFVSWWTLGEVKYQAYELAWIVRGICIFFFVLLACTLLFLLSVGSRVARCLGGEVTKEQAGLDDPTVEEEVAVCCERGCFKYLRMILRTRPKTLTDYPMDGDQLYARMEGLWTTLSLMGAVLTTMSFLAYQQGLTLSPAGVGVPATLEQMYPITMLLALCLNFSGTYICTFFLMTMSFVPTAGVDVFIRKLGGALALPTACLFFGTLSFLLGQPIVAAVTYGPIVRDVCTYTAWPLGALAFVVVVALKLSRGYITRSLYRAANSENLRRQAQQEEETTARQPRRRSSLI